MMLTEEKAKEKACCKVPAHRKNGILGAVACLGSGCMAWRWSKSTQEGTTFDHPMSPEEIARRWEQDLPPPMHPEYVPEYYIFELYAHGAFWVSPDKSQPVVRHGYCGLAGRGE